MLLRNFCRMCNLALPQVVGTTSNRTSFLTSENNTGMYIGGSSSSSGSSSGFTCLNIPDSVVGTATSSNVTPIAYGVGIRVGTGTTQPQFTNYQLESRITSGLTYSCTVVKNNSVYTVNRVTTNTSSNAITINEVGLVIATSSSNPSSFSANSCITALLTRTVLQTPIVIQPNETRVISITINADNFSTGYSVS